MPKGDGRRIPKEEVIKRLADSGFTLLEEYVTVTHKTLIQCKNGHQFRAAPRNQLSGSGCRHCKNRLSKEDVENRLCGSGIAMVGKYLGSNVRTTFQCDKEGHQWLTYPSAVFQKTRCMKCFHTRITLTKEQVNERISSKGIELVGYYLNSKTPTLFECRCGHTWSTSPDSVMFRTGCPACNKISKEQAKASFTQCAKERGYAILSEYINTDEKVEMECPRGHRISIAPMHFKHGKGCRKCAKFGFNSLEPGVFYLYHLVKDGKQGLGFGITNNFEDRDRRHKRIFSKTKTQAALLVTKDFKFGEQAYAVELLLKKQAAVFDFGIEGFKTECLPISSLPLIKRVLNIGSKPLVVAGNYVENAHF